MAVDSKKVPPPKVKDKKKKKKKTRPGVYKAKKDKGGANYETATKLNASLVRCLRAAGITDKRLEIIAMTDYKPLQVVRDPTLAGELFNARVLERAANLESLKQVIENVELSSSSEFNKALNQYDSAVVATEAEFALLKMLLLLQKYATHTARFLDFINEYVAPEGLDNPVTGDTMNNIEQICSVNFNRNPDKASLILIQLLCIINCCSFGISPKTMNSTDRSLDPDKIMTKVNCKTTPTIRNVYDFIYLARDMTFSREVTRIRDDEDPDESFAELLENLLGSSFITSPTTVTDNIMRPVTGTSAFGSLRGGLSDQNKSNQTSFVSYLDNNSGALSKIRYDKDILIPETYEIQYNKVYNTVETLVDEAFTGRNVLDFSTYSTVIDDFIASFKTVNNFGLTAFRLGDKATDTDGSPRTEIPLVSTQQPLSPQSVCASMLEIFNRRFASTVESSLMTKFYDWQTPEHVNYTRVLAWLLIRDNPDLAKQIVRGVINDYEAGFLTAAGLPEPIDGTAEVDEEGNEIAGTEQLTEISYVKPGTATAVNLSGRGTSLNGQMKKIFNYYSDEVPQMKPTNTLSSNLADDVSYPEIRVQYERWDSDYYDYFGSANSRKTDPDLRLINCIGNKKVTTRASSGTSDSTAYLSNKIIGAEIIDATMEALRAMVTPFHDVSAASDGDAILPYVPQMKAPYGTSKWNFSEAGYEQFQINLWVDTITQWNKLFTRESDNTTFFRRRSIKSHAEKIIDLFSQMISPYDWMKVKSERLNDGVKVYPPGAMIPLAHFDNYKVSEYYYPVCATIMFDSSGPILLPPGSPSPDADGAEQIEDYCESVNGLIDSLLETTPDDLDSTVTELQALLSYSGAKESRSGTKTPPANNALILYSQMLKGTAREENILWWLYDFIGKYAERVQNYKDASLGLIEGEDTPLADLITSLRNLGDPGTDVLQSLSVNQMALKQVALEEEVGDEENAFLPKISVISKTEINSVRALCNEPVLKSPEGDTTKVVVVGLPNGIFNKNNIDDEFCLRVSYTDIEYPQIVFRAKSYKFHKDLYVLPTDLDAVSENVRTFTNVINKMNFSKIRVEVIESEDASAEIEIVDDINTLKIDDSNRDIYVNLAVSELMKIYYRLLLGTNFSETKFPSTPEGVHLDIPESLGGLYATLAENIENIGSFSESLANNIDVLMSNVKNFENPDDFVSGEITSVDESLLSDLKNAYQTRLFSPEVMRSNIISAKMFDRVYALPVDPDEFYIVSPEDPQVGNASTPQSIFDFYFNAGIIEETGLEAPFAYKLAPRKTAEGSMAFGNVTVSLTTVDDASEGILGL